MNDLEFSIPKSYYLRNIDGDSHAWGTHCWVMVRIN